MTRTFLGFAAVFVLAVAAAITPSETCCIRGDAAHPVSSFVRRSIQIGLPLLACELPCSSESVATGLGHRTRIPKTR